jgi:hypothetical protein
MPLSRQPWHCTKSPAIGAERLKYLERVDIQLTFAIGIRIIVPSGIAEVDSDPIQKNRILC